MICYSQKSILLMENKVSEQKLKDAVRNYIVPFTRKPEYKLHMAGLLTRS